VGTLRTNNKYSARASSIEEKCNPSPSSWRDRNK